ncbi:uncharacterized protein EV420DRAFT_1539388 [Desarmillaria tabescens]|uniref:Uncharacterized protein n=1 Tax=Armillaria tabescens TaxID=1929756 RepID=A0AA39KDV6_ARMTA|nr:uncharacterized protein EV420DRAFT_1539388 [Desarmillaria tabescens]KAK0459295.1 hypothetical protein EV420DRAFT_1539388 [Desarmillaria tabescens]
MSCELKQEANAQSKTFSAMEERLQRQIDALGSRVGSLERYKEDCERNFEDQLRYETVDRFCRGLTDILQKKIVNLNAMLHDLSSRLENEALRYPPNAFVFLSYYLHYDDDNLPEVFHLFPLEFHRRNVATLSCIIPSSGTALNALSLLVDGPHGRDIKLLTHFWAVRASFGTEESSSAHPVPGLNLAYETLQNLVDDPEQQAQIRDILPLLVDVGGYGVNRNVKYFSSAVL